MPDLSRSSSMPFIFVCSIYVYLVHQMLNLLSLNWQMSPCHLTVCSSFVTRDVRYDNDASAPVKQWVSIQATTEQEAHKDKCHHFDVIIIPVKARMSSVNKAVNCGAPARVFIFSYCRSPVGLSVLICGCTCRAILPTNSGQSNLCWGSRITRIK